MREYPVKITEKALADMEGILFRSKDVEKSGAGFQRVNDFCKK